MSKIIRAYELCKNDIFVKLGSTYVVHDNDSVKITYKTYNERVQMGGKKRIVDDYIGANSKERVEWIGKYEPSFRPVKIKVSWLESKKTVSFYESIFAATKDLGLPRNYIKRYLLGQVKYAEKRGYHFEAVKD